MDTIGLDLHKRESQLCVLTDAGEIVERQIVTSREARSILEPHGVRDGVLQNRRVEEYLRNIRDAG